MTRLRILSTFSPYPIFLTFSSFSSFSSFFISRLTLDSFWKHQGTTLYTHYTHTTLYPAAHILHLTASLHTVTHQHNQTIRQSQNLAELDHQRIMGACIRGQYRFYSSDRIEFMRHQSRSCKPWKWSAAAAAPRRIELPQITAHARLPSNPVHDKAICSTMWPRTNWAGRIGYEVEQPRALLYHPGPARSTFPNRLGCAMISGQCTHFLHPPALGFRNPHRWMSIVSSRARDYAPALSVRHIVRLCSIVNSGSGRLVSSVRGSN